MQHDALRGRPVERLVQLDPVRGQIEREDREVLLGRQAPRVVARHALRRIRYHLGMKMLFLLVVALTACSKQSADGSVSGSAAATGSATTAGSGSATAPAQPVEDVSCSVAAKEYTKKMAATPGNVLSDAKPGDGLVHFTAISMEDYCAGEGGCCVPWTPQERACVKAAAPSAVSACFTGAALSQVNAGLTEVVTSALANKKTNDEAEKAAGSSGK